MYNFSGYTSGLFLYIYKIFSEYTNNLPPQRKDKNMKHYLESTEAVFKQVDSTGGGLSSAEASKRLEANGKNKFVEAKKDSTLKRFLN